MKNGPALVDVLLPYFPFSNLALGFLLYLPGLAIAWFYGHLSRFLDVWYAPLTIIGIVWVTLALCWGKTSLVPTLQEIRESFDVSDEQYEEMINGFLEDIYADRKILLASIPGIAFAVLYVSLLFYEKVPFPYMIVSDIVFQYRIYFIYGGILAVFGMYLVSTGTYFLAKHALFVQRLSKLPIKINVLQIGRKTKLDVLATFSMIASFTWSVATSLAILATVTYLTVFTIAFTLFASLVALLSFLIPLITLHRGILRAKRKLLSNIAKEFKAKFDLFSRVEDEAAIAVILYCILFNEVERLKEWPIETRMFGQLPISSFLPILATIIKLYLPQL